MGTENADLGGFLTAEADAALGGLAERIGAAAAEEAKRRAPVRTGRLRNSIGYRISRAEDGSVRVALGTDLPYAAALELGTSKRPGLHFIADGMAAGAASVCGG